VYRFAHVLYQDALTESIAPSRRIEWALRIAEALLLSHGERTDGIAGSLAVLFETGREFWKASQFYLATSRHAARLFAWVPASDQAGRGLQCLRAARDIPDRDKSRRELELSFARLVPLASIQGYASAEVEQLTQHVVQLAEEFGDVPTAAAALIGPWIVRIVRGDCLAARDAAVRLASLGDAAQDDVLLINGHMQAQIACHHLGEFSQARDHACVVMTLADRAPHGERCINVFDPVVASLAESARNNWITGYLARACSDCDAAVTLAKELRHPDSLAFAWLFHAWIHGYRRDWHRSAASSETGITIARESGSVQTLAWNGCVHGWAVAHAGNPTNGEAEMAAAVEASKGIRGEVALPQFSAMMAEVLLIRGDLSAAETCLAQAMDFEKSHDDGYFSAEVRRLLGVCLARLGRTDEAHTRLREAREIAREQAATMFELRAALSLAEVSVQEGRVAARDVLARFPEPEPWPEIVAAQSL
jgi:tetratricopeptide (TPR) repeat protein